ncbi:aminoglycoside phosphotransferase family protein [Paractinoplanes atraurantiacus]|uniref:Predicted kinase, aminoglycoside phosphotransferase (APT) family n=1 Tax=Paractinoplanes atraurantiacus TaxID=1036182 RepID=A0A285IWP9_9ACTN|nr:aminoglycoside phosphotransferase family protein [Actinoplanes atraurantiacus]SNY52469.1 Predicted kinase, aminoglycoside phosphotransferase (APT) family [Actinoplanes atraurantiacus]
MPLHPDEIVIDAETVRSLLVSQCPQWADLPLSPAGGGTENTMYRLGDDLLVRLPRSVSRAAPLLIEQRWLPRLAPHLPLSIPVPLYAGRPSASYPAAWSVLRWIDGSPPSGDLDWASLGRDLFGFVAALHDIDIEDAVVRRWYRSGELAPCDEDARKALAACRPLVGDTIDIDLLEDLWSAALTLPRTSSAEVWLHTDLKPTNLLVRGGRLSAVIDFGGLTIGFPDAEHAPVWDLPPAARDAYWNAAGLDGATWQRARAWAIFIGASGIPYYWDTYPAFVTECRSRLQAIASASSRS